MRPNHTLPGRPRDRTGASIAGEHHQPLAHSAKASPSQSPPASAGPVPQSPGTHDPAPESVPPLLSTISRPTQNTRKTPSPKSPTRHPPTTHPGAAAGPDRSEHCRRTSSTPRAQRENLPLSEPACERRPGLAEPTPGIQPNSAPTASARLNPFKEPWEKTSGSEIPQHRFRPRWPEESSTWPPSRMEAVA